MSSASRKRIFSAAASDMDTFLALASYPTLSHLTILVGKPADASRATCNELSVVAFETNSNSKCGADV